MVKNNSFYKQFFWHLRSSSFLGVLALLTIISPVVVQSLSLLQPETSTAVAQYKPPQAQRKNGGPAPNQR